MKLFSKTKRFLETISIITFLIFTGVISCSKGFNDHKPVSVFKGKNLVTFGNSITIADNSWAYQTFTKLEFGNLYNGAFDGARLCKTNLLRSGQIFVTQDYDDPGFAGIANNWSDTTATGYQKIANNCGIVHIQKYLAEHGDRIPNFIILSYGTNDLYDARALGNPQATLQENDLNKLDVFTVPGALKWCLVTLKTEFSAAKIYVALPIQAQSDTKNAGNLQKIEVIKTVCDGLLVPYFDCYNECGITQENEAQYLYDGVHPNAAGQALQADYIIKKLKAANEPA